MGLGQFANLRGRGKLGNKGRDFEGVKLIIPQCTLWGQ